MHDNNALQSPSLSSYSLSGMNPMTNTQKCTCQQSLVNCDDNNALQPASLYTHCKDTAQFVIEKTQYQQQTKGLLSITHLFCSLVQVPLVCDPCS